jgi:peptidoglycan/LPS O-acetylase OafA/YrhL
MNGFPSHRLAAIDAVKAIASQLIVLHHLAFYGPMSDYVRPLAPGMVGWFADHARLAVQAFIVVAGFLAARALAPEGVYAGRAPAAAIARRYARLAFPALAAILLAIVGAAVARAWMTHPSIPAPPTLAQVLAHALLLQDILGFDSLSAGLWYVAIDFQLFTLLLVVLLMARRHAPAAVALLACVSLFAINRQPQWDIWAPYFFGAYGLGAFAWWCARGACRPAWGAVLAAATLVALAIDFRTRIATALIIATLLYFWVRQTRAWPVAPSVAWLGRIAYSVFLVHFPVCLVLNAAWTRFAPQTPWSAAIGIVAAWATSIAVGALFHRIVEARTDAAVARLAAWGSGLRRATAAAK